MAGRAFVNLATLSEQELGTFLDTLPSHRVPTSNRKGCTVNHGNPFLLACFNPHDMQINDTDVSDNDALRDKFPSQWSVLADKGYQGIQEYVRGLTPVKRPRHGHLTMEQERANAKWSSDRVIVENFFGRLKRLWGLVSDKYTWKKDECNMYFQTCVALTNVHVRFNPLRNVDGEGYTQY
ncbi:hypothetical protein DYB37_011196 [Aphanomyces astaci]|uniref:DDE Tnp4 domain-containing protein n=1 Tax=Aphanomyces astaci TaxID=112090 RepID=A0A3R7ACR8_APHAT|nr:hypothetical protein DYB35_013619 [Aphanomyces astaci]RHZ24975.1 hypothetical protein DYB37_011196 [Aphanomyces astaci]